MGLFWGFDVWTVASLASACEVAGSSAVEFCACGHSSLIAPALVCSRLLSRVWPGW